MRQSLCSFYIQNIIFVYPGLKIFKRIDVVSRQFYFVSRQCFRRQQTTELGFHQTNADILDKIRKRRESSADITVVRKESEHRTNIQSDIARYIYSLLS